MTELLYQSCQTDYIVVFNRLEGTKTNESRDHVADKEHALFRADKLLVTKIYHKQSGENIDTLHNSIYENKFYECDKQCFRDMIFTVGSVTEVTDYDDDINVVCDYCLYEGFGDLAYGKGIHYYKSEEAARYHEIPENYTGEYKSWHDDGQLMVTCNYVFGQITGLYQQWSDKGNLLMECKYCLGKFHGPHKMWLGKQLIKEYTYANGILHGKHNSWYADGTQRDTGSYINGKMNGKYISWHPNGKQSIDANYVHGTRKDTWTSWHDNGQIKEVCHFSGHRDHNNEDKETLYGTHKIWNKFGELIKDDYYNKEYVPNDNNNIVTTTSKFTDFVRNLFQYKLTRIIAVASLALGSIYVWPNYSNICINYLKYYM